MANEICVDFKNDSMTSNVCSGSSLKKRGESGLCGSLKLTYPRRLPSAIKRKRNPNT